MGRTTIGPGRGGTTSPLSPTASLLGGDTVTVGEVYSVDLSASEDPDGSIKNWTLDWDDGVIDTGRGQPTSASHIYDTAGSYVLVFTVFDQRKHSGRVTFDLTVLEDPSAPDPDTVPDAFVIPDQLGVPLSTAITSVAVPITGMTDPATITISDGNGSSGSTYSIDNGAFTDEDGTITDGQEIRVKVTSSALYKTSTSAIIAISGVTEAFSVTTLAQVFDTTPAPFSFASIVNAALDTDYESSSVQLTGFDIAVPISVTNGEYAIDGGAFTSSAGTVAPGQTVRAKLTSSSSNETKVTCSITAGGTVGTFSVTTLAAVADDDTPDDFNFQAVTGQPISTVTTSNTVTITGINTTVDVTIAGATAQYSKNGGSFTSGAGTCVANDTLRVRITSSGTEGATVTAALTVGTLTRYFAVTTAIVTVTSPTYYVDKTNGSNNNNGSSGSPWQTLAFAVPKLRPGDTLQVKAGSNGIYQERLTRNIPSGTNWTTGKVRIVNFSGHTIWLTPTNDGIEHVINFGLLQQYIEIDGINCDNTAGGGVVIAVHAIGSGDNAHHIRIQNLEVKNGAKACWAGIFAVCRQRGLIGFNEFINVTVHNTGTDDLSHGFYIGSDDNLVERCTVYDVPGCGVHIWAQGSENTPSRNRVKRTLVRDLRAVTNARHAGILAVGNDNQIENSITYGYPSNGSGNAGIVLGGARNKAYFSTIYGVIGTNAVGMKIDPFFGAQDTVVRNVISYACNANYQDGGANTQQSNNLFGSTNPLFTSAGSDFTLQSGSPADNAGVPVSGISVDFAGTTRHTVTPCIGAFER